MYALRDVEPQEKEQVTIETRLDCGPKGKKDVLDRLEDIHRKMHSGKHYGFEQSIWCDAVREIRMLRAELAAMTDSRNAYSAALVKESARG